MKLTVIAPTFNRPDRHQNLYHAFQHQTYEDKELLVLDDSPTKSPFFQNLTDSRVTYIYLPPQKNLAIKRNLSVEMAKGEIIAQFDDDDYYAPTYLEIMVHLLEDADLIKLSKWLAWREADGTLWEWDTGFVQKSQFQVSGNEVKHLENFIFENETYEKSFIDKSLWGYEFTFVYRKSLWESSPFNSSLKVADYDFILRARKANKVLKHTPHLSHLCLHTLHKGNTIIYPQKKLGSQAEALQLFGPLVLPWLITTPNNR